MTATVEAPAGATTEDVRGAAFQWHDAGFTVLPVAADGTKRPIEEWKQYQYEQPSRQQMSAWFEQANRYGLGAIMGAISGNVEMFELEGRAVAEGAREKLVPALKAASVWDVWQRLIRGYVEQTPSGGLHFIYKLDGREVPGNAKVARRPKRDDELDAAERKLREKHPHKIFPYVLAETRGEGGFCVLAPSFGPTHTSGNGWHFTKHSRPGEVATITWDERVALFAAVHAVLDEMPEQEPPAPARPRQAAERDGERPGDAFARTTSWADILQPHGWVHVYRRGNMDYWRRPGDDKRIGWSARTGGTYDGLWVWSTSTVFDTEVSITKFRAYSILEHGGNDSAAAAKMRRDGFGAQRPARESGTPSPPIWQDAPQEASVSGSEPGGIRDRIAMLERAREIIGHFTGNEPGIPPLAIMEEVYDLLYKVMNPDGLHGKANMTIGPDYPTKWLPPVMQAQIEARGALATAGVGAGMLGCASAAAMTAELYIEETRRVVPTLWVPLIGDAGCGKTPAANLALAPYRAREEGVLTQYLAETEGWLALDKADQKKNPRPKNRTKLLDDATLELIARRLRTGDDAMALISDELTGPLRALGQYKKDGGPDKARFLALWSGQPWLYERVGSGEEPLFIPIQRPVFPVFGTIQPEFVPVLGDVGSGMQARWLPHYCGPREGNATGRTADEWWKAISKLLGSMSYRRRWEMPHDGEARREHLAAEVRWTEEQADPMQSSASSSFLAKAEEHSARMALVIAEADEASRAADEGRAVRPGQIPVWAIRAAVDLVDYCADVWRALPNTEAPMAHTYADRTIVERDGKLNAWLRKHGGSATKREIQLAKVAGARTSDDVKKLIQRHVDIYGPGCLVDEGRGSIRVFAR